MPSLSADGLSARDRRTLGLGAVAVSCVLLAYAALPVLRQWSDREDLITARRSELAKLRGLAQSTPTLQ